MTMRWRNPRTVPLFANILATTISPGNWAQANSIAFHREHFNPYLNFHRPCYFPVETIDKKGKVVKRYPYEAMTTPYEKLKSLPDARSLSSSLTSPLTPSIRSLHAMSDNEAVKRMNAAKRKLFKAIFAGGKQVA